MDTLDNIFPCYTLDEYRISHSMGTATSSSRTNLMETQLNTSHVNNRWDRNLVLLEHRNVTTLFRFSNSKMKLCCLSYIDLTFDKWWIEYPLPFIPFEDLPRDNVNVIRNKYDSFQYIFIVGKILLLLKLILFFFSWPIKKPLKLRDSRRNIFSTDVRIVSQWIFETWVTV